MDPTEAAAMVASLITMFGSLTLMVRFITNSPRRRNRAEIEKLTKLKELGLLETYRGGQNVSDQLTELTSRLAEHDRLLAEMREDRDFYRKLIEKSENRKD